MESGDGWVHCRRGHRHWGRFGACGLHLVDQTGTKVVLQHRAVGTHEGGTWSVPGGARDSTEDYVTAALREAAEEAGIGAQSVAPLGWHRVDHGGWSYSTVLARAIGEVLPRAMNWESEQVRWVPVTRVEELPLHPGFAAAWPQLRRLPQPLAVIIDTAYVLGSDGDLDRLVVDAAALARAGIPPHAVPVPAGSEGIQRWLPHLVLVVDAAAGAVPSASATLTRTVGATGTLSGAHAGARAPEQADWPQRQISIVSARGSVADAIDAQIHAAATPSVVVVAGSTRAGAEVDLRDAPWWNDQVAAARAWRPDRSGS